MLLIVLNYFQVFIKALCKWGKGLKRDIYTPFITKTYKISEHKSLTKSILANFFLNIFFEGVAN